MVSSTILMLVSYGVSAIFNLLQSKIDNEREKNVLMLERFKQESDNTDRARKHNDTGFKITRRIIALTFVLSCVLFPNIPYVLLSFNLDWGMTTPIVFGYDVLKESWWPFGSESRETNWMEATGFLITPWHTDMIGAIVGFYFGDRIRR